MFDSQPHICSFHRMQGIEPEVRTFNTVIIACNMSGQAAEALKVYERMLNVGAQPTATTYTALIRCAIRHETWQCTYGRQRGNRQHGGLPHMASTGLVSPTCNVRRGMRC